MATSMQRRVVLFSPGWPPAQYANGIVSYIQNLRDGLVAQGVDCRVLTPRLLGSNRDLQVIDIGRGPWTETWRARARALSTGIASEYTAPYNTSCWVRDALRDLHRRWPFGIFEVEESFGLSLQGKPPDGAALIVRLHGPWFLNGAAAGFPDSKAFRWRERRERKAIERATAVTSPSHDVLERVRRHYGLELPHAAVIPNPVPTVSRSARWNLASCQPHQLLFVGRFDRHKGGDVMLDGFTRVAQQCRDAELLFVGPDNGLVSDSGRILGISQYLAERVPAEVRGRVHVLGVQPRAAVEALRRQAFVTVVPSRYETFSMTAAEAMANGSPLIAASAGAIPELAKHEHNALVFPSEDAEALANQVLRLFGAPEFAASLGAQAARDSASRLSSEVVARDVATFYDSVSERLLASRAVP